MLNTSASAHADPVTSLGDVEADFFDPARWKTEYPNPAFIGMDAADAFWAASIVSRFSDEMIRAVVETGELSDPNAARQLGDIIIERRDKVVAYWMTRTNPLDQFRVSLDNDDPRLLRQRGHSPWPCQWPRQLRRGMGSAR